MFETGFFILIVIYLVIATGLEKWDTAYKLNVRGFLPVTYLKNRPKWSVATTTTWFLACILFVLSEVSWIIGGVTLLTSPFISNVLGRLKGFKIYRESMLYFASFSKKDKESSPDSVAYFLTEASKTNKELHDDLLSKVT